MNPKIQIVGYTRRNRVLLPGVKKEDAPLSIPFPGGVHLLEELFGPASVSLSLLGEYKESHEYKLEWIKKPSESDDARLRPCGSIRKFTGPSTSNSQQPHLPSKKVKITLIAVDAEKANGDARIDVPNYSLCSLVLLGQIPKPEDSTTEVLLDGNTKFKLNQSAERQILLTSCDAFVRGGYRVREDGSTSAAIEDLVNVVVDLTNSELVNNVFFQTFTDILVRIRADAILHFKVQKNDSLTKKLVVRLHYVLDGDRQEWSRQKAAVFGLDEMLAISITRALADTYTVVMDDSIEKGLKAIWHLVKEGLCKRTKSNFKTIKSSNELIREFQSLLSPKSGSHKINIGHIEIKPDQFRMRNNWELFKAACVPNPERPEVSKKCSMFDSPIPKSWRKLSMRIAAKGLKEARWKEGNKNYRENPEFPYRVFELGKIESVDRHEIDELVGLQRLMTTYVNVARTAVGGATPAQRPLNIGAFGSPGSGKSFGVKQIAKSLGETGLSIADRSPEFNVAQFTSLNDLAAAIHEIRDVSLETGKIPIAFFDEFDAEFGGQPFGWLKYFLMPMQDGKFMDGTQAHHTGSCILIFAGGINHSFPEFNSRVRDRDFCQAKGPDFISRLRGVLNIPSLNQPGDQHRDHFPNWMIRRARMVHYHLDNKGLEIKDDRLLEAFLSIPRYLHGARSLEALIDMCVPHNGVIGTSSLPRRDQTDIHVDSMAFWKLINGKKSR